MQWQKSKKVRHIYVVCGKVFYAPESQKHRVTCSDKCKGIWSTMNQAKKKGLNKLEMAGRKILEDLGLIRDKDFFEQYLIEGKFLVDVYIPDAKVGNPVGRRLLA